MEYFEFLYVFLAIIILLGWWLFARQAKALRLNIIENVLADNLLCKKFFATAVLENWARYIDHLSRKKRIEQVSLAAKGDLITMLKVVDDSNLRKQIKFLIDVGSARNLMKSDELSEVLYIMYLVGKNKDSIAAKKLTEVRRTNQRYAGLYLMLEAQLAIREGQLREASEKVDAALKIFKKLRWLYEEASAYCCLGDIYRLAEENDAAEMMYKTALKIWQDIKCNTRSCETLGCLGMLCASQGRFEQAEDYFEQAEKKEICCYAKNLYLTIICHHAMLDVLVDNPRKALKRIDNIFIEKQNDEIMALAKLAQARAKSRLGYYKKACDLVDAAVKIYEKLQDNASVCEAQYLMAEIYLQHEKYQKAEVVLHEMLTFANKIGNAFVIADIYTALGLAMMGQDNLSAAKNYFYEALNLGTGQNNFAGMAVDYMNLAEIFRRQGEITEQKRCLEAVLQYANCSDEIFIEAQKKLKQLNQMIS